MPIAKPVRIPPFYDVSLEDFLTQPDVKVVSQDVLKPGRWVSPIPTPVIAALCVIGAAVAIYGYLGSYTQV